MASFLGQDVSPEELQLADHVYLWGSARLAHHGLVFEISEGQGDDDPLDCITVLHLSCSVDDPAKVRRVTLREFIAEGSGQSNWSGSLKRARYGAPWAERTLKLPGNSYPMEADEPSAVLQRAQALLEISEGRPDDLAELTTANSEHVIVWCKTNHWRSSQVDGTWSLASAAAIAAGAAAACGNGRGAALLPLLGVTLLWKATQEDGLVCEAPGAPAALLRGGCSDAAVKDELLMQGDGLESETDYVIVYESDVAKYVVAGAGA